MMIAIPTRHPEPEQSVMFTVAPSLAQRLERLIQETPIVDPHTHLRVDQPGAPDLAALLSYHWVQTELRAVGLNPADADPALPPDERVCRALPYLARIRNTATAWCLRRLFRDLYDFDEPVLDASNYRDLFDRVADKGCDPAWAWSILRDQVNVRTVVTSLGNRGDGPIDDRIDLLYMLDAHYLFCPGVATDLTPFFPGRTTKGAYYEALATLFGGERPATVDRLRRLLLDWLDATVAGPVRFSNTFLPIEQRFHEPDPSKAGAALDRGARGDDLDDPAIDELVRLVTWTVLGWHHERRMAFQIAVGAEYFICEGKSIPRTQETWTTEMCRAFHHFSGARFDLMIASDGLLHESAVVARQFPNVYVSGYWWHNFVPAQVERIVTLRMQVAPMTKFGGFLCDAYYAEWSYAKFQVVKKALASALARMVESGLIEEDELPAILHQVLHDTPRDLYDLGRA